MEKFSFEKVNYDDFYFEDHVKDGFYVPSVIKQAWATEMDVLSELDRIARKYNINYFADWGTLLGAVRHGGFVPWDDDLDIVMLRKDYENFIAAATVEFEKNNDGFEFFTFENHNDYWLFITRVVAKGRICFEKEHLEKYHGFPYIAGLDITVLDNVPDDSAAMKNMSMLAKKLLVFADTFELGLYDEKKIKSEINDIKEKITVKYLFPAYYESNDKDLIILAKDRIEKLKEKLSYIIELFKTEDNKTIIKRQLYSYTKALFSLYDDSESTKVTQMVPLGINGSTVAFDRKYYDHVIELPFENRKIRASLFYDKILGIEYGNFMRLVKSTGAHGYPFFETQKKQLEKIMGFKVPDFEYNELLVKRKSQRVEAGYKYIIRACINNLEEMSKSIEADSSASLELLKENLPKMQEYAIYAGETYEKIRGEGTDFVSLLESFCEKLFELYSYIENGLADINVKLMKLELDYFLNLLSNEIYAIEKEENVLFLMTNSEGWKYYEPYYKEEKDHANVFILPLSLYSKSYDGLKLNKYSKFNPEDHNIDDANILTEDFDILLLNPDKIYIQNPFDNTNTAFTVDEKFYSDNLQEATQKLIYIPDFSLVAFTKDNYREYHNMFYYAVRPGVIRADNVILESENLKNLYVDRLCEFSNESLRKFFIDKIAVVNRSNEKKKNSGIKKMLYYISQSSLAFYEDKMLEKIEKCLKTFNDNKEKLKVYILFDLDAGQSLKNEYSDLYSKANEILTKYLMTDNLTILNMTELNVSLLEIIENCDAYYGDASRYVAGFINSGKPVMIANAEC